MWNFFSFLKECIKDNKIFVQRIMKVFFILLFIIIISFIVFITIIFIKSDSVFEAIEAIWKLIEILSIPSCAILLITTNKLLSRIKDIISNTNNKDKIIN